MIEQVPCVVIAGGVPQPDDPLYALTGGKPKALLQIANGRSLLDYVLTALHEAEMVGEIVVAGLGEAGQEVAIPAYHLPDAGGMVSNGVAGLRWLAENYPNTQYALCCSADIPLLTASIVDRFIADCASLEYGVYYNLITRQTAEAAFPNSKRTFTKLKDIEMAGGDLHLAHVDAILNNQPLWEAVTNARKSAWKIARLVGLRMLLKLLFRQVAIPDIEETATRLLGLPVKAVVSPYVEVAMDADKPHQIEMLRNALVTARK